MLLYVLFLLNLSTTVILSRGPIGTSHIHIGEVILSGVLGSCNELKGKVRSFILLKSMPKCVEKTFSGEKETYATGKIVASKQGRRSSLPNLRILHPNKDSSITELSSLNKNRHAFRRYFAVNLFDTIKEVSESKIGTHYNSPSEENIYLFSNFPDTVDIDGYSSSPCSTVSSIELPNNYNFKIIDKHKSIYHLKNEQGDYFEYHTNKDLLYLIPNNRQEMIKIGNNAAEHFNILDKSIKVYNLGEDGSTKVNMLISDTKQPMPYLRKISFTDEPYVKVKNTVPIVTSENELKDIEGTINKYQSHLQCKYIKAYDHNNNVIFSKDKKEFRIHNLNTHMSIYARIENKDLNKDEHIKIGKITAYNFKTNTKYIYDYSIEKMVQYTFNTEGKPVLPWIDKEKSCPSPDYMAKFGNICFYDYKKKEILKLKKLFIKQALKMPNKGKYWYKVSNSCYIGPGLKKDQLVLYDIKQNYRAEYDIDKKYLLKQESDGTVYYYDDVNIYTTKDIDNFNIVNSEYKSIFDNSCVTENEYTNILPTETYRTDDTNHDSSGLFKQTSLFKPLSSNKRLEMRNSIPEYGYKSTENTLSENTNKPLLDLKLQERRSSIPEYGYKSTENTLSENTNKPLLDLKLQERRSSIPEYGYKSTENTLSENTNKPLLDLKLQERRSSIPEYGYKSTENALSENTNKPLLDLKLQERRSSIPEYGYKSTENTLSENTNKPLLDLKLQERRSSIPEYGYKSTENTLSENTNKPLLDLKLQERRSSIPEHGYKSTENTLSENTNKPLLDLKLQERRSSIPEYGYKSTENALSENTNKPLLDLKLQERRSSMPEYGYKSTENVLSENTNKPLLDLKLQERRSSMPVESYKDNGKTNKFIKKAVIRAPMASLLGTGTVLSYLYRDSINRLLNRTKSYSIKNISTVINSINNSLVINSTGLSNNSDLLFSVLRNIVPFSGDVIHIFRLPNISKTLTVYPIIELSLYDALDQVNTKLFDSFSIKMRVYLCILFIFGSFVIYTICIRQSKAQSSIKYLKELELIDFGSTR